MVDNFGNMMVLGYYEGNLKAIVDKLNSLRWSWAQGWVGCWSGPSNKAAVHTSIFRKD